MKLAPESSAGDTESSSVRYIETVDGKKYDPQIYDDKQFYSMLLKVSL